MITSLCVIALHTINTEGYLSTCRVGDLKRLYPATFLSVVDFRR